MAKAKTLNGKDLMLFHSGKAIALNKSFVLTVSGETIDAASKDDGIWKADEIGSLGFDISSNGLVAASECTTGDSYAELMEAMLAHKPIDIVCGVPTNIDTEGEVPEGGWTAPTAAGNFNYKGKVIITSVKLQGDKGAMASMDVSMSGYGPLTKITG